MAERRLPGLQRVLGVNALFSTAYGNVGSSIYYALGLVASLRARPVDDPYVRRCGSPHLCWEVISDPTTIRALATDIEEAIRASVPRELGSQISARAPIRAEDSHGIEGVGR